MEAEREIGSGPQAVYVYYFDEQRTGERWPCKVGCTTGRVANRIKAQLAGMLHRPTLALVIRTSAAVALESMLHEALRGHRAGTGGDEWFNTNPAEVEALAQSLVAANVELTAENIGTQLKRLRSKRGLTQEELAAATGLRQATISRAEAGRPMMFDTLSKMFAALDARLVVEAR